MPSFVVPKYLRVDPSVLIERELTTRQSIVIGPPSFIAALRPRYGVVAAVWDESLQLGCVSRYGLVTSMRDGAAILTWSAADATYRPNPAGRRWWKQEKPFFCFAPDVVARYMLAPTFADYFPDNVTCESGMSTVGQVHHMREPKPSVSPIGGYVYLVRSPYGIKIGKSVNVKSRTRLFEVKLPFPISVEHYAWFDDYSHAERQLHQQYHAKRLEGEWFALLPDDIAHIKTLGKPVLTEHL